MHYTITVVISNMSICFPLGEWTGSFSVFSKKIKLVIQGVGTQTLQVDQLQLEVNFICVSLSNLSDLFKSVFFFFLNNEMENMTIKLS